MMFKNHLDNLRDIWLEQFILRWKVSISIKYTRNIEYINK